MNFVVERTCTELSGAAVGGGASMPAFAREHQPLSVYRSTAAFVLLGDPGSGKSTEFDQQSRQPGAGALMVSARDFITLDPDSRPEWRDKVLFIDGLDEMRAGGQDSRLPLDEIRKRLDRLRPPGFRISCREADWLGHSDRQSLKTVSPDSEITVLRLDELQDQQVMALLRHRHNRTDGQAFSTEARQRGVGGLLVNPLTLRLLVDALRQGGDWPDSRLKTLEMACRQIATEHNQEHRVAKSPPPLETIVDAAGYLCALQLLTGFEGYVTSRSITAPSFMSLTEMGALPDRLRREDLEHALTTKLFRADREGFVPLHRQVAEFLAGRHLAKLIDGGLPARRVVALMAGPSDERVATSLRGLSAWLAAHSCEARPSLISVDPVGVGLYGDLGDLSTEEKKRLLESLSTFAGEATLLGHQRRDGRSHRYRDDTAWAFRCLATADMAPTMRGLISDAPSGASGERLTILMLEVLANADDPQSVVDLGEDLEAIVWDGSRSAPIRSRALDAYLHIVPASDDRTRVLRRLLDAVQGGSVPDPDDQVRGVLLEVLYPDEVTPSEVWDYARPRNEDFGGRFRFFWSHTLLDASSDEHLTELLDSLHEDASRHAPVLMRPSSRTLPEELLARCLEANGDHQDPERLYGWLAAGVSFRRHHGEEEPTRRVRAWLEARPHLQKQVVLSWLRRRDREDPHGPVSYWFCEALHGSKHPPDFGLWCLDQAIRIGEAEPEVSEGLLFEAYRSLHEPSTSVGLTLEVMRDRTRGHPVLARHLDEFCERSAAGSSEDDEFQREMAERREQWDREDRQRRKDWESSLREHEDELWENRLLPQNLATLADVSLGLVTGADRHASPRDRISEFIGGDPRLVDGVMAALRSTVSRDDLPDVDRTISWSLESRHSWLARPVLASLELLDTEDPERLDHLQDEHKRKALAICYCVPHGTETPPWHARWLQRDPELVLDVLSQCALADVRAGKEVPSGLNELDLVEGHDDRVHEVRLRLLDAFPTRSSNKQLPVLDRLLTRTLDHPDKAALLALVERKQASKSMPVAQQVRWWGTDALIVQGDRLQRLKVDLAESEVRIRHLAQFLRHVWDRFDRRPSILAGIFDPSTLRELIEILGRWFGAPQHRSGFVTLEMEMSDLIGALIRQLGSVPSDEAQRALVSLVEHPDLEDWHPHLAWAMEEQRVIHRDASYSHPSIEQVQDTLNDGPPANAADLKALLVDRLSDMYDDLRGGSSDFWSQFWNEEQHHLTGSKPENSCRDALLTNLRLRLPDDVDVQPEGSYVADSSSDIRASHNGFNVPIEIKKDCHPDVWRAVRNQLMAKYTTDPATEGYGIYMVLWFADANHPVTRHPGGARPRSPDELGRWLEQDLSPAEAHKISVIVMDATKPGEHGAAKSASPA